MIWRADKQTVINLDLDVRVDLECKLIIRESGFITKLWQIDDLSIIIRILVSTWMFFYLEIKIISMSSIPLLREQCK